MEYIDVVVNAFIIGAVGLLLQRGHQGLRADIQVLRADMQVLRVDIAAVEEGLRVDIAAVEQGLRVDIAAVEQRLTARMDRLEGTIEAMRSDLTRVALAVGLGRAAEGE